MHQKVGTLFCKGLLYCLQSEIASERPGVFDCLREGATRLLGWGTVGPTRQLPVWKLVAPTVTLGLCHYVISSMAQYTVLVSLRTELLESKVSSSTVSWIHVHVTFAAYMYM